MISLLLAMDENRVIGKNNDLPWHLPADLKYFKTVTMGHSIVMGRKTYESIGSPLPGRKNIVITRDKSFHAEGVEVVYSIQEIVDKPSNMEVFVIGGAEVFNQILPAANRLYITHIHHEFEGDTFFPEINMDEWEAISKEKGIKDERNPYDYYFAIYQRKES